MRRLAIVGLAGALAVAAAAAGARKASAEEPRDAAAAYNERCANRLAIAFLGKAAAADQMRSSDPRAEIDDYLATEDFRERFARFVNTEFNAAPGSAAVEDAPYYVAKRVLRDGLPWSEMFLGRFRISPIASTPAVFEDNDGLGYFRTYGWYARYEGNEESGLKLSTAYRIMNNVVGLELTAVTTSPNADQTAAGRRASPCNGCHFEGWYALDKVASILPKKGQAFDAYDGPPQEMLGGKMIRNDKELVVALVASENYYVHACRLAFTFLYGRKDNRCDGPTLDRCVDTFKAKKTMQSALASIAREPGFCE